MSMTLTMPQTGQLPKVKGPDMNERDELNDMLAYEKYLSYGYDVGLREMQNVRLYPVIEAILNDVHQTQRTLFELMFKKGWYKMKTADSQEIQQAQQQFLNYKSQFPVFTEA